MQNVNTAAKNITSAGYGLLAIDPVFWGECKLLGLLMVAALMLQREANWLGGAFIIGGFFANKADNLIGLFLGVELLSLSTVLAVARGKPGRAEEGLKYLVLSAVFSGFFIVGSGMILWAWGTMGLDEIRVLSHFIKPNSVTGGLQAELRANEPFSLDYFLNLRLPLWDFTQGGFPQGVRWGEVGVFILATGLLFKLGGAPFHRWPLELYTKAENQGFLMVVPKLCWVSILGTQIINRELVEADLWAGLAVASLVVGAIGGLRENKVRRILVWSSVANLGYLILALTSGPTNAVTTLPSGVQMQQFNFFFLENGQEALPGPGQGGPILDGAEIYVVVYFLSSLLVWLSVTPTQGLQTFTPQTQTLQGSAHQSPMAMQPHFLPNLREEPLKGSLAIAGLLALAGVPPFWGFVPKVWLLYCLVEKGSIGVALIVGLCSVASGYYYFRLALQVMNPTYEGRSLTSKKLELKG